MMYDGFIPAHKWPNRTNMGINHRLYSHYPTRQLLSHPQCLSLHPPGLLPGRLGIHLPGAPQVNIACLVALTPGGHPVGVGLGALFALFYLLHLPDSQILKPGLELQAFDLRQGRLCFCLQPLGLLTSCGQVRCGLLQGFGIPE